MSTHYPSTKDYEIMQQIDYHDIKQMIQSFSIDRLTPLVRQRHVKCSLNAEFHEREWRKRLKVQDFLHFRRLYTLNRKMCHEHRLHDLRCYGPGEKPPSHCCPFLGQPFESYNCANYGRVQEFGRIKRKYHCEKCHLFDLCCSCFDKLGGDVTSN